MDAYKKSYKLNALGLNVINRLLFMVKQYLCAVSGDHFKQYMNLIRKSRTETSTRACTIFLDYLLRKQIPLKNVIYVYHNVCVLHVGKRETYEIRFK